MKPYLPVTAALLLGAAVAAPAAQVACTSAWNVQREVALFASRATTLKAGVDQAAAPGIQAGRLYELQLTPQPQVHFALAPGKVMLNDGAYAGLVKLRVAQPGSYRVAIDVPFWIDVVSGARELPTEDFTGTHDCSGPRKLVEYVMPANQELLLQFSGATAPQLRVTVTKAPPSSHAMHRPSAPKS
jgi:hypothetical protein